MDLIFLFKVKSVVECHIFSEILKNFGAAFLCIIVIRFQKGVKWSFKASMLLGILISIFIFLTTIFNIEMSRRRDALLYDFGNVQIETSQDFYLLVNTRKFIVFYNAKNKLEQIYAVDDLRKVERKTRVEKKWWEKY